MTTYVGIKSLRTIPHKTAMFIFSPQQSVQARNVGEVRVFPQVVVGILAMEQDSEVLQRKLYRYGRALIELIQSADPAGWTISTGEGNEWLVDFVSTESDSVESDYVGEVTVQFRAYAWEN